MSAVSQVKKLKITVTNIRSVLMKRTKRLANLKKINKRDTNNFLSSQRKGAAEKKLESPLKGIGKIGSGITGLASKTGNALGLSKMFDALKLLGLGVGVNAVFENFDEIKEGAKDLKKKIDKWWETGKKRRRQIDEGLSYIDGTKLKEMSKKFSKQTEKLEEEFEKLNNPNSVYTIPDPNNPDKKIRISAKKFWNNEIKKEEDRTGKKIPRIEEKDFSNVEPIKKDTNLSSLLNSNGSSGDTVILARQNIIYEA